VTLCHATGSATNPYVMITVDYHALENGHTGEKGDIIPPTTINGVTYSANWDANGQAIFNNGCKPVAAGAAAAATPPPAAPTPPPAAPVVPTPPPTVTTTTTTPTTTTVNETPVITATVTVPATTTVTVTTPSTKTVTTSRSSGGVMGAETSLPKPAAAKAKPGHGVLGTVTHVTGGTLPFTGFPVWVAILIAVALILGGIALRRRTAGARL
jgi:hypothetical protein